MATPPNDVRDQLRQCVHDLNNVLGQVLGFGSLLVRDVGEACQKGQISKDLLTYAEELLAAGLRGEAIAKELAAVVRAMPGDKAGAAPAVPVAGTPQPVRGDESGINSKGRIMLVGATDLAESPLASALRQARWSIDAHRSGATALRAFRANPESFDALLTQQAIPEIRGTELITALKALHSSATCVILLDDPKTDQTAAQLAGASACLSANTPAGEVVATIDRLVTRARAAR